MIGFIQFVQATAVAAGLGAAAMEPTQPPADRRPAPTRDRDPQDRPGQRPDGRPQTRPLPPEPPEDRPRDAGRSGRRDPGTGTTDSLGDPGVAEWLKMLTDKMTDPHDTIRDGARAALVAAGPAAVPVLKRFADDGDGAKAVAARKVLAMIDRAHPKPPTPPRGGGVMGGMMGGGMMNPFQMPGGPNTGPMGAGRPRESAPQPGGAGRDTPGRGGPGGEAGRPANPFSPKKSDQNKD